MVFSPQALAGITVEPEAPFEPAVRSAPAAAPVRVRIVLTQAARAHVLQCGLSKRLGLLIERADTLASLLLQGDRIGLSESAQHDLYVLRRRLVIELAGSVLEVTLEVPGARS